MAKPRPSSSVAALYVEAVPIASLRPRERNARKHSKKQIRQIAASIQEFGWTNPILIDKDGVVIAGHGRLEAAKLLGMTEVSTLRLDHLTPEQVRAYVIADNRLAEKSGWDQDMLRIELGELAELDFDVRLTGFDTAEVDAIIVPMLDDEDEPIEPELDKPATTRLGDLWLMGTHRLYCGDSTHAASYAGVLGDQRAEMVFTDPPYNVPIRGNVTTKDRHGEFVMASGEMTSEQFTTFLTSVFAQLATHSIDGSIHFVCMDWRHMGEMLAASKDVYAELKNLCVWNKANAGMGSLYRSKHEFVFVFKAGTEAHINNVALGKHGRHRSNVWPYAGVNSPHKGRAQRLEMHPTVKPVTMIADAILDCSNRNGWILDAFGGSGSTLIAAETTGRRAALIELDPRYVDATVRRYERLGKGQARLAETGQTWAEVAADRAVQPEVSHG
ncbi:MAG TPA: DNA methyltransferase [Methylibium sp.]|uniref:site-specific DNA-methyltransferase n=1 Tax=Methylibium sp. TaxID=2067992 RepID=UPI002DBA0E67|nr:DNA methyltransferase [Methylibium sp.]HEU4459747.1 DNA methyltransferase [Methylibium sp.]